jgi:hypothetical protein
LGHCVSPKAYPRTKDSFPPIHDLSILMRAALLFHAGKENYGIPDIEIRSLKNKALLIDSYFREAGNLDILRDRYSMDIASRRLYEVLPWSFRNLVTPAAPAHLRNSPQYLQKSMCRLCCRRLSFEQSSSREFGTPESIVDPRPAQSRVHKQSNGTTQGGEFLWHALGHWRENLEYSETRG